MKYKKFMTIALICIFIVLWIFHPTQSDFINHIAEIKRSYSSTDTVCAAEILIASDQVNKGYLNYDPENKILFNYKNYQIFSVGLYVQDRGSRYREIRHLYLGILGFFVPLMTDYIL